MSSGAGRDDPPRRRRGRRLASDDEALWRHVAKSVTRLPRAKPRVPETGEQVPDRPETSNGQAPASRPAAETAAPRHASAKPSPRAPPGQRPAAQAPRAAVPRDEPSPIERRQARRIAGGQIEIDARLDLHGLTQAAAHARLAAFLSSAVASGLKTVLVITGKGGRAGSGGLTGPDDELGVLRRNVPRWLREPAMRSLIVGFGTAARHHGGEGAFYIQLKRRARIR